MVSLLLAVSPVSVMTTPPSLLLLDASTAAVEPSPRLSLPSPGVAVLLPSPGSSGPVLVPVPVSVSRVYLSRKSWVRVSMLQANSRAVPSSGVIRLMAKDLKGAVNIADQSAT